MGNACSVGGLSQAVDGIRRSAGERVGTLHISGRFHRLPHTIDDDYELDDTDVLGTGFAGKVISATRVDGGGLVAVKTLRVHRLTREKREELEGELEVALSLSHPHIVELMDVYEDAEAGLMYFVMEKLTGGEVLDRIQDNKTLNEQTASIFLRQMLLAVNYLHLHDIVHRDLKPENFLIDMQGGQRIKLIDFGFAKHCADEDKLTEPIGTRAYAAPEVLKGSYNKSADLWSLGVILYVMLAGAFPFYGSDTEMTKAILHGSYNFDKPVWQSISENAKDMVSRLLVVKRSSRITAEEAFQHPFILTYEPHTALPVNHQQVIKAFRKFTASTLFQRAAREMCAHSLPLEQRRDLEEAFLEMDTDHSGTLSLEELREVMVVQQGVDERQFRDTFAAMDFHNDGEITYTDFLAAACFELIPVDQTQLRETFNRFDLDGDGYVSPEELKEICGAKMRGVDVRKFIAEADKDGDHRIDFDEFVVLLHAAPHLASVSSKLEVVDLDDSDAEMTETGEEDEESGDCRCIVQ